MLRPFDSENSVLLAVESATARVSVALQGGAQLLAEAERLDSRHHAESLLPLIDEVLTKAGLELASIDAFAISIGPGNFTTLRIGLATIKGLAFASDLPVAAVSSLAAVAHGAGPASAATPRIALLDARRDEVYAAAFECSGESPTPLSELLPESVYGVPELAERLREAIPLIGAGALRVRDELARQFGLPGSPECRELLPHACSVAALGFQLLGRGEGIAAESLVPHYGRRAQAEEDRVASGR